MAYHVTAQVPNREEISGYNMAVADLDDTQERYFLTKPYGRYLPNLLERTRNTGLSVLDTSACPG